MEFDDAIRKIGQFGKYQTIIIFSVGVTLLQMVCTTLNIVFVAAVLDHWCATPELEHLNLSSNVMKNLTLPMIKRDGGWVFSSCSRYKQNYSRWSMDDVLDATARDNRSWSEESCPNGWIYDKSTYTSTIVSEWDLVCENDWLQATVTSVYMVGFMVGAMVSTSMADIVGRRSTFLFCVVAMNVMTIVTSFATSYTMFCVMRFFSAIFSNGTFTVAFVIALELVGPDYRTHAAIGIDFFWAAGYIVLPGFAYFFRDWSKLTLVSACSFLPFMIPAFFVPESARWLYSRGLKENGDVIIKKAARINKVVLQEELNIYVKESQKGYFWDLWRTRNMACMSAVISFSWFSCTIAYYGLSLGSSSWGGNYIVNVALAGVMEAVAYAMTLLVVYYGGRRWPICGAFIMGGASILCMSAVPTDLQWLYSALALFGKFAITIVFAILFMFTAELYPTVVRSTGVGFGSFFGRIGGVISPVINQLADYYKYLPFIIFGVLSVTAGLLTLLLPETKGRNLPQSLQDGEKFARLVGRKEKIVKRRPDSGKYLEVTDLSAESQAPNC